MGGTATVLVAFPYGAEVKVFVYTEKCHFGDLDMQVQRYSLWQSAETYGVATRSNETAQKIIANMLK